jgi:hypothetical protein
MLPLRAALFLVLAGSATSALAEQITCESHQAGNEACGTVQPGSAVRLVQQLSNTPCVEGSNWGVDPTHESIWVAGGCRAVFDVQPPPDSTATSDRSPEWQRGFDDGQRGSFDRRADSRDYRSGYRAGKDAVRNTEQYSDQPPPADGYRSDEPRSGERSSDGSRYARADQARARASRACVDQAAAGQSFGPDQVATSDVHWIGHGMFSVSLDTPDGALVCTADGDGNVRSIDNR